MKSTADIARQREKELQDIVKNESETREPDDNAEKGKKEEPVEKSFRYYFNRFRYYHYYYSEKVRTFIMAGCMWTIKIQLYILGLKFNGPPSIHETEERRVDEF